MASNSSDNVERTAPERSVARPSFLRFDREDWIKWINGFLNEEYCEPAVVRGPQESCVVLGNVYHELESKSQRDLFGDAIKILFESTPIVRPNSGYLRSILELLALLKPYQAKSLLRRHLFARSLLGMKDGGIDLHTLLLIVN